MKYMGVYYFPSLKKQKKTNILVYYRYTSLLIENQTGGPVLEVS